MNERPTDPAAADKQASQLPIPRTGEDGKPIYDQEFFLALARCGKKGWNRWREGNPEIPVTFKGVAFRPQGWFPEHGKRLYEPGVNFSGFEFGDAADFSGAFLGDNASFIDASFGSFAKFSGATFGHMTYFIESAFGPLTNFSDATFSGAVYFDRAIFEGVIDFSCATFQSGTTFSEVIFGFGIDFSNSAFESESDFSNTRFTGNVNFSGATFYHADFSGATFDGYIDFRARSIDEWKQFRARRIENVPALQSWSEQQKHKFVSFDEAFRETGPGPHTFQHISFSNARFFGFADFSRRNFKGRCDLTGARFHQPPSFDAGDRLDRLDLYGTRISFAGRFTSSRQRWMFRTPGWTTDSDVANQLRRLRDLADTTKNHDLERDLYIEERKAERGILIAQYWRAGWRSLLNPRLYSHCLWIAVMAAYSLLADYGRSFVRPLVALFASVFIFHAVYWMVLSAPSKPSDREEFRRAIWAFSIANAVPFVGALSLEQGVKLQLFCEDKPRPCPVVAPGTWFQVVALGQSIFSALCIFFTGLALRNYFKLR